MEEFKDYSQIQVVALGANGYLIQPGWHLLKLFEGERVETVYRSEKNQYGSTDTLQNGGVACRQSYLMLGYRRDEELDRLRADLMDKISKIQCLETAQAGFQTQIAEQRKDIGGYQTEASKNDKQLSYSMERLQKMERDLALVRIAIGEKQMKQILEEAK